MNDKTKILYSDPINEIISVPPRKLIRRGTTIIFALFLLLLILAWVLKYPDIVPAPIEITTVNPPVTLLTKVTGRINKIYVKDGEKVASGKLLAIMETTASIDDVNTLRAVIDSVKRPAEMNYQSLPLLSDLGDLQSFYASFLKAISDYDTYVKNDFYGKKIASVTDEISVLEEYINRMKVKERLISENLRIEGRKYSRDSTLYIGKVYSESDLEKSKQSYNSSMLELQEVRLNQSQTSITLEEKKQLLQDYIVTRTEEKQNLSSVLDEAFLNLQAQVKLWENKYLLVTPVAGTVTFTKYWSENQSVTAGEHVIDVVPDSTGAYIGRMTLSMQRSGKVKPSMKVNIKLSGFPYLEYGMVRGYVKSKSLVASGDAYIIEVTLPHGLTTLYNRQLDFTQNMQGTAEIITDEVRLLQRIINPFRYIISRNKS
ncbi:MAG: HlyD family efflux transporter periplasmic adaptor subunit [Bacteroidales bacterium]